MANNVTVKDAAGTNVVQKTTDNAGVHTPHHNVDSSALPTGAATETTLAAGNTLTGAVTETAPASDTASSGLNGRLQRIAQRLTTIIAGLFVSGDTAHDAADAGNPVKIGGLARNADQTAVANSDRVNALFDLLGKQITLPYALPENFVSGAITTAMTGTTSTSLLAAPGAGLRNYITAIVVSNAHASVGTDVLLQDGSGGTTLMTIPAASAYGGAVMTLPSPLRQPTANTALFAANVQTGSSTKVSVVGYKGV
jgi:hypothetical protein